MVTLDSRDRTIVAGKELHYSLELGKDIFFYFYILHFVRRQNLFYINFEFRDR